MAAVVEERAVYIRNISIYYSEAIFSCVSLYSDALATVYDIITFTSITIGV